MFARLLHRFFPKLTFLKTKNPAQVQYTEADRLTSFILIEHLDQVNDILQNYGQHIDISDDELSAYVASGKVPLRVVEMAALVRPLLIEDIHTFLSGKYQTSGNIAPPIRYRDMDTENRLRACVRDWQPLQGGIPYRHFYEYIPVGVQEIPAGYGKFDFVGIRQLVWNFKYSKNSVTPYRHMEAMYKVIDCLVEDIQRTFGTETSKLTFFCVPASTQKNNWLRYCEFSMMLCRRTGMTDAFDHIFMQANRKAKHEGGIRKDNYYLDGAFFSGRFVLMFDDVVTTGKSLRSAARQLKEVGAFVMGAYSIARSIKIGK